MAAAASTPLIGRLVGGGMGLVVTGLLMNGPAGYHRVFWLTTAFVVVVIAVAVAAIPTGLGRATGTIDRMGAAGLAAGLSALLLTITHGNEWGWSAPATIGCAASGVLVLWAWERRRPHASGRRDISPEATVDSRAMNHEWG